MELLRDAVTILVPMILSLTVHEYAHARVAYALGDRTALAMGRMNLNPLSHIDLFGTIILPVIAIWSHGPFFGWAKPVPVNPLMFKSKVRMRTGMLLTAIAGPLSNVVFAVVLALLFRVVAASGLLDVPSKLGTAVAMLVSITFQVNVALAVFNFIPVPPLDGSKVLAGLLPDRLAARYEFLERNPVFVILGLVLLVSLGGRYLNWPIQKLSELILHVTGAG